MSKNIFLLSISFFSLSFYIDAGKNTKQLLHKSFTIEQLKKRPLKSNPLRRERKWWEQCLINCDRIEKNATHATRLFHGATIITGVTQLGLCLFKTTCTTSDNYLILKTLTYLTITAGTSTGLSILSKKYVNTKINALDKQIKKKKES